MTIQVVIPENLGKTIKAEALEASKYDVNIDQDTIVADANGVISVDKAALDIVIVSTDADNVLVEGSDTGALLTTETFQDLVGDMVVDATDGLTYDDAIGALTAAVASSIGIANDSIKVGTGIVNGVLSIEAKIIINPSADNALTETDEGLLVDAQGILSQTTNEHEVFNDEMFVTTVNGVPAKSGLTLLVDAFENVKLGNLLQG